MDGQMVNFSRKNCRDNFIGNWVSLAQCRTRLVKLKTLLECRVGTPLRQTHAEIRSRQPSHVPTTSAGTSCTLCMRGPPLRSSLGSCEQG